jgi:hypothetical protein
MSKSIRPVHRSYAAAVLLVVAIFSSSAIAGDGPAATWVQLDPASSPSARAVSAMAYDPVSKKVVMFGGFNDTIYLNDTWTWDGTTWTQENTPVAPSPRTSAMMAYDSTTRKLVLFGGYDGTQFLGDTWLWDGATSTWTLANPASSPKAMAGTMLFTDPRNGHTDLYGGFDGRFYQLDTWRWVGGTWKNLHTATSPLARAWAVVGVDLARKIVILSGGLGDVRTDNTWTWDGSNWTQQTPSTPLPKIFDTAAAFDPDFRVVIDFGGDDGNGPLNTNWAWTGSNWFLGQPLQSPPARELHGMAYDFASKQLIVFGGTSDIFLNDTWSLVSQ